MVNFLRRPVKGFLCGVVLLLGISAELYGQPTQLRVGYLTTSASFSVLWVTKEAGIFKKNGLDVETVYIPPAVLTQAMLAGEVPIGISGGSSMMAANLRGADFVLLGSLMKRSGLNYLVTRKEIRGVEDLKGKKFGISRLGAAPHRILQLTLTKLGMDPEKDVVFLQIGNPGVVLAAIRDQRVDAGLMSVDTAFAAKKLGLHVLSDLRELGIEYLSADMVTTRKFIRETEDTVRGFVKAMVEGLHYFKTQKQKSLDVMAKYMRVNDKQVLGVSYDWYAEEYQRKPYISLGGVKAVLAHLAAENPKAQDAKPDEFFDSKYVKELDESGFIDHLYK